MGRGVALGLLVLGLVCGASWLLFGAWWSSTPTGGPRELAEREETHPVLTAAGEKPEILEAVDPRWLLAEFESGDRERQQAAYDRAQKQETLAYDEALARHLIPFLVVRDAAQRSWAFQLLRKMGGAVVPLLAAYYPKKTDDPRMRREALLFLMFSGELGYEWVLPRFKELLEDEDPDVARAARTIVSTGIRYDAGVAEFLLDSLKQTDRVDYYGAEKALARMGPEGIAHLLAILDDPRSELHLNALLGLAFARPEHLRPHLPTLSAWIGSDDEDQSVAAIKALHAMQGDCKACLPALIDALTAESILVQQAALRTIRWMGERAADAVPALLEILADDDVLAGQVAGLLGEHHLAPQRALPALAAALGGDAGDQAAKALASYGADALPYALEAFRSGDEDIRYAALLALGRLGPAAREVATDLPALIRSEDADLARRALNVAGRIGPDAAAAVPAVLECLWTDDLITPAQAAYVLMRLGDAAQEPLCSALKSADPQRRLAAVEILVVCSGWSGFALDDMAKLLGDEDVHLRHLATKAILNAIYPKPQRFMYYASPDPDSDPALRARVRAVLVKAKEDPARRVSHLAEQGIAQIDRLERGNTK